MKIRIQIWSFCLLAVVCGCAERTDFDLRTEARERTEAENQIYQSVVRDLVEDRNAEHQIPMHALVFHKSLDTEPCPGMERNACVSATRVRLNSESSETLYREAVEDFLRESVDAGRLSTEFGTDLPRVFVDLAELNATANTVSEDEHRKFKKALEDAGGIVSLSRIGFDHTLHFGIVSSSFYCGPLCGSGRTYIVRKKWGRWVVIKSWTVWIS